MQVEKAMFAMALVLICVLAGAASNIFRKEFMCGMGRINGMGDLLQ